MTHPLNVAYTRNRRALRWIFRKILANTILKMDVEGMENFPRHGPAILMINHISAADPVVACCAVDYEDVVALSKAEALANPLTAWAGHLWGVVPIRRGEVDRNALRETMAVLNDGGIMLMAPEGTRQKALGKPHDGIVYIATRTQAAIVPVGLSGTDAIKHNVFRLRRTPVHMKIGPAFTFDTGGKRRVPREVMAQMADEAMFQLAACLPEALRGAYADLDKATTEHLRFA